MSQGHDRKPEWNRRDWIGRLGLSALAASAAPVALSSCGEARGASLGQLRAEQGLELRRRVAEQSFARGMPTQVANGDESRLPRFIGSYSKGLPHDANGEVDQASYRTFRDAMLEQRFEWLDTISIGPRKLVNPKAGMTFALEGGDPASFAMPPAPSFDSAEMAAEMVELYWMALARDVPFIDYAGDATIASASAELSALQELRAPKVLGQVQPATLFRGVTPGDLIGPYLSQFLLGDVPFGVQTITSRSRTYLPGIDHVTNFSEWLAIQNGFEPSVPAAADPVARHPRSLRDLAAWVHVDRLFQAHLNAALRLLELGVPFKASVDEYVSSPSMIGFPNIGPQHVLDLVTHIAVRALRTVWFQKWFVHRRIRPEAFSGRIDVMRRGQASYPIHSQVLASGALAAIETRNGTSLLPQAFIEGCPLHPAYGAGHATAAGACTTILKAFFDESVVLPNPVVASGDGLSLLPYVGSDAGLMTVGGELDKLASNIALGRNGAGVHWRSDATDSLALGEAVAEQFLREQRPTLPENVSFRFTRFDGSQAVI